MAKKNEKLTPAEQILTKLYNGIIYKKRHENLGKGYPSDNTLLEIDDWSKVTPQELQQQIDSGAVVDWVNGYDSGPSPLTDALQQGASSEIIGILVANGANVDTPTVLPSGTKVTPLEIVRLQPATHDNLQKELILLRAGAKDDVINWVNTQRKTGKLENLFKKGACLRKVLRFMGYKHGAKVFEILPNSYIYIMEQAGKIWDDFGFDIYDKGIDFGQASSPSPQWLYDELGTSFAKLFLDECGKMSLAVAMHEYYMCLSSLCVHNTDEAKSIRISAAARDLRNNYFTKKDWQNLIAITHNITAKAEYSKMMKKALAEVEKAR